MMDILSKFSLPGILLLLTMGFGVWVSLTGKPYNGLLFNLHKLIALATLVFLVIRLAAVLKSAPAHAAVMALLIFAAVCVLALFVTGALMSIGIPQYQLVLTVHRIGLVLLPMAMAGALYLLNAARQV